MIQASTPLTIQFTAAKTGYPMITNSDKSAEIVSEAVLVNAGETAEITTTWGTLCSAMASAAGADLDGNCNPTSTKVESVSLQIGISKDNDDDLSDTDDEAASLSVVVSDVFSTAGYDVAMNDCNTAPFKNSICEFGIQSGDEKAVLTDLGEYGDFPTLDGIQIYAMRVYFEPCNWGPGIGAGDFATISTASTSVDLPITVTADSVPELLESEVTGMTNGTTYCAKIGHVDEALNVGMFTPGANDMVCNVNYLKQSDGSDFPGTCHVARPDEVLGILSESCFIATAAYGSKWSLKVQTFRDFRNKYLAPSSLGRKLVKFYYKHSPKFARKISESEFARATARIALTPVWVFANVSLKIGLFPTLILTFTLLAAPILLFIRRRKIKAA